MASAEEDEQNKSRGRRTTKIYLILSICQLLSDENSQKIYIYSFGYMSHELMLESHITIHVVQAHHTAPIPQLASQSPHETQHHCVTYHEGRSKAIVRRQKKKKKKKKFFW